MAYIKNELCNAFSSSSPFSSSSSLSLPDQPKQQSTSRMLTTISEQQQQHQMASPQSQVLLSPKKLLTLHREQAALAGPSGAVSMPAQLPHQQAAEEGGAPIPVATTAAAAPPKSSLFGVSVGRTKISAFSENYFRQNHGIFVWFHSFLSLVTAVYRLL